MYLRRGFLEGSIFAVADQTISNANDPLGMLGHGGIMGDDDDGDAFLTIELLEHLQDLFAGLRIQIAGWFVCEEQRQMIHEGAGDCHALLLPARQLRWLMIHSLR